MDMTDRWADKQKKKKSLGGGGGDAIAPPSWCRACV